MTAAGARRADLADAAGRRGGDATAIPQLDAGHELDVDGAYAVQEALLARRLDRGERLVGLKMGLTSRAKMAQVGVDEVIWGRLTDAMRVPDGGSVDAGRASSTRGSSRRWRSCCGDGDGDRRRSRAGAGDHRLAVRRLPVHPARRRSPTTPPAAAFVDRAVAARCRRAWTTSACCWRSTGGWSQAGSTAAILGDPRRALDRGPRAGRRRTASRCEPAGSSWPARPPPPCRWRPARTSGAVGRARARASRHSTVSGRRA